jgi:hypothetical protein
MVSDDSLLLPQSAYVPVEGAECGLKSELLSDYLKKELKYPAIRLTLV